MFAPLRVEQHDPRSELVDVWSKLHILIWIMRKSGPGGPRRPRRRSGPGTCTCSPADGVVKKVVKAEVFKTETLLTTPPDDIS